MDKRGRMYGFMLEVERSPFLKSMWSSWLGGGFASLEDCLLAMVTKLAQCNADLMEREVRRVQTAPGRTCRPCGGRGVACSKDNEWETCLACGGTGEERR